MKNFSTWLLACFMVMFWAFRVVVTLMAQLNQDFGGIVPINETLEIIPIMYNGGLTFSFISLYLDNLIISLPITLLILVLILKLRPKKS